MKKRENITWTEAALMCDEEIDLTAQDDHGVLTASVLFTPFSGLWAEWGCWNMTRSEPVMALPYLPQALCIWVYIVEGYFTPRLFTEDLRFAGDIIGLA